MRERLAVNTWSSRLRPALVLMCTCLACHCKSVVGTTAAVPAISDHPHTSEPPSAASDAIPSPQRLAPVFPQEEMLKQANALLTELRAALLADDSARFARALSYPVLVRTPSRCDASVPNQESFLQHFQEIVSAKTRALILAAPRVEGSINYWGFSTGNISVHNLGNRLAADAFWVELWRLPDLPCLNETELEPPEWLNGNWTVTSVVELSALPNVRGRADMDLTTGRAHIQLGSERELTCRIGRYGSRSAAAEDEFSAARWGLTSGTKHDEFVDLECGPPRQVQRLEVLGPSLLGLFRGQYTLVFRPQPTHPFKPRLAMKGEPCGIAGILCAGGLACKAESDTLDSPTCAVATPVP